MLRYIERNGLIEPQRSAAGYRLYGAAQLQRLRTRKELLGGYGLELGAIGFALRLRPDPPPRWVKSASRSACAATRSWGTRWRRGSGPGPSVRTTSPPPTGSASSRRS